MDPMLVADSFRLPEPDSSWTIPVAIGLAVLAALSILKKLVALAIVLALLAVAFVAYQNGAFDEWVEKSKVVVDTKLNGG